MEKPPQRPDSAPIPPQDPEGGIFRKIENVAQPREYLEPAFLLSYKSAQERMQLATSFRTAEIRPYLHRYFESIQGEITHAIETEHAATYLEHLHSAWRDVAEVNKRIDTLIANKDQDAFPEWSLAQLKLSRGLLEKALEAEHTKNIYSGGLKRKIEAGMESATLRYGLTSEEVQLIGTVAGGTFHERYNADHMRYFLSDKDSEKEELRLALLRMYHGNDPRLLDERMASFSFETRDSAGIAEQLESISGLIKERTTKKNYLMLGRQELKTLEALLRFDNWDEYLYIYRFSAFPEAILRSTLMKHAQKEELISEDTHFLQLNHAEFLALVDRMIEKRRDSYDIDLEMYRQTDNTCGSACVMSILERVGVPMSREAEIEMWDRVGKPYNFPGGMAKELMGHGFRVDYHQYPDRAFSPSQKPELEAASLIPKAEEYVRLHEEAVTLGMNVEIADWDLDTIIAEMQKGRACIVGTNIGGSSELLHWEIAQGYRAQGNSYEIRILDPLGNRRWVGRSELESKAVTSMGKRMLSVYKIPAELYQDLAYENS